MRAERGRPTRAAGIVVLLGALATAVPASASNWAEPLAGGSSGASQSTGLPSVPTGAGAACTSALSDTVRVTWSAVARASSYGIYQATSVLGPYSVIAAGVTGTSWTSPALATGNYWYEVNAADGSNWQSAPSSATAESTVVNSGLTTTCIQP